MANPDISSIQRRIDEVRQRLQAASSADFDVQQSLLREMEALQALKKQAAQQERTEPPTQRAITPAPTQRTPRKARPVAADEFAGFHWPDHQRGVPNQIARSGLFNVRINEPRRVLDNEAVATLRGSKLLYSGEELRIRDEDVFVQCCHFQRASKWGEPWRVTGRDFLLAMQWTTGACGYRDLYESLLRLSKGHITLLQERGNTAPESAVPEGAEREAAESGEPYPTTLPTPERSFALKAGSLIDVTVGHDARRGARSWITVRMSLQSRALWETMGYTVLDWDQRLRLKGTLARFLHRFYASHSSTPYPFRVETLRLLTGSATRDLSRFRQLLRESLRALVEVGFLVSWRIDAADTLHVRRATDTDTSSGP